VLVLIGVVYFLGWHLQPFEPKFFSFHDDTQVGRIKEFAFSLRNLQIPPRLAPHFSFDMGFPVFNFYSPFSYWVGGILTLVGLPAVIAAKTSFFLAIITMFVSMYLFISLLFSFEAGLIAAAAYTSSTWIATEIFARGNLGELWFIALIPLCLYLLEKNSKSNSVRVFIFSVFILSFTFTSHNVLSLICIPLLLIYSLTIREWKKNLVVIFSALLLSSYFFIPLIGESSLTYAKAQAEKTVYSDHFLCPMQLWSSPTWELGGSGVGCNDGMSFKLGKIQLILGMLGFLGWIISFLALQKKNSWKENGKYFVLAFFGIMSLFMMFDASSFLWKAFSFVLTPFQFPWRFNSFFLLFVSIFAGYFIKVLSLKVPKKILLIISLLVIGAMFVSSRPYFRHPWRVSYDEYTLKYVSDEYISKKIVYAIPEYLPRTANYDKWMGFGQTNKATYVPFIGENKSLVIVKNLPYEKQGKSVIAQKVTVNIHYFPFWYISVDGKQIIPKMFDSLGRPTLSVSKSAIINVKYKETTTETAGNIVTIITFFVLVLFCSNKKLWKKVNNTLQ